MIARNEAPGYAQIGYKRATNLTQKRFFLQATYNGATCEDPEPASCYTKHWGDPNLDETWHFRVSWYPSDNHIHLLKCDEGGTNCVEHYETTWNPYNIGWGGSHAEFFGETLDNQTDMTGTDSFRTNFKNREIKVDEGDWFSSWLEACMGYEGGDCTTEHYRYHFQWVDNPHFRIWTDPLS